MLDLSIVLSLFKQSFGNFPLSGVKKEFFLNWSRWKELVPDIKISSF
jgi:hypothetical protein